MKQHLKKNPHLKLIGIMVGAIFLIFVLVRLIPWQILLLLLFLVLVIIVIDVSKEQANKVQAQARKTTPVYRPPASSSSQAPLARPKRQKSPSPGATSGRKKPKYEQIPDYEQPQAQYPEQPPPMMM